jgi:hypothetical protein
MAATSDHDDLDAESAPKLGKTLVEDYREWNEVTGVPARHSSWDYEIESILEDGDKAIGGLRDLARHLRCCRECGETDVRNCHDGRALWNAAMPTSEEIANE